MYYFTVTHWKILNWNQPFLWLVFSGYFSNTLYYINSFNKSFITKFTGVQIVQCQEMYWSRSPLPGFSGLPPLPWWTAVELMAGVSRFVFSFLLQIFSGIWTPLYVCFPGTLHSQVLQSVGSFRSFIELNSCIFIYTCVGTSLIHTTDSVYWSEKYTVTSNMVIRPPLNITVLN